MPEKHIKASDCEKYFYEHLDDVHIAAAMNAIDEMPAADVAPVCHGRWETGYFHDRVCSCCTHPDNDLEERAHRFCPHCGAKMDEKECENNA